jgi:hypothetical protein
MIIDYTIQLRNLNKLKHKNYYIFILIKQIVAIDNFFGLHIF